MPESFNRLAALEHRWVPVHDTWLHYVTAGSNKPPMLLLHGIGMDWHVWQAVSRRLAPHFALYMIDLRGHGDSGKPRSGYTLGDYAADVEQLIENLGLTDVTLVGSSLGAMAAVVVEAPVDIVARRVLVDPPIRRERTSSLQLFREILRVKQETMARAAQEELLVQALEPANPGAGRLYLRYMAESWQRAASGVISEVVQSPTSYFDVDAVLPFVDSPTLVMRGNPALGGALDEREAEHLMALLPDGHLRYFPDAGHAIHGSQPAKFVEAILAFADAHARTGAVERATRIARR